MSETEAGSEDRRHEQPFVAKGADDVLNELGARPDGGPAPAVQAQAERYARGFLAQSGVREYKQPMPADHTGSREDWERNKLLAQQAWEVKQAGIQANWEKLRAKDHIGTLREAQQKVPLMPVAEVTKEARNRNLNHSEQLHEERVRRLELDEGMGRKIAPAVAASIIRDEPIQGEMPYAESLSTENSVVGGAEKPKRLLSRLADKGRNGLRRLRNRNKGENTGQ